MRTIKKKYLVLFVLCFYFVGFVLGVYAQESQTRQLRQIQEKTYAIKQKLKETKIKERIAVDKLTYIQRKLSQTQDDFRKNKSQLITTEENLKTTEQRLAELKGDYFKLTIDTQGRIRQIYQGQRLKMLEHVLKASSFTDFLDSLYYQKLIIARDKILLEKISTQAKEIQDFKDRLSNEKEKRARILDQLNKQKVQIASEHSRQQVLVQKLKTERATFERAERQLEQDSQKLIADINRLISSNRSSGIITSGSGLFSYPLRGKLTSPFGPRRHPIHRVVSFHSGIDLAAPYGTAVMASDNGRVIFNGWYGGYGKVVILDHGMTFSTLYAHLSRSSASQGSSVKKGETVGYEGTTGYSTGPHVHFEVRVNGKPQNPLHYLQ